ncbi:putative NAD(P)/FAD-binding protein YdhS [Flavobacterium sp. HSC-32F16]|uniref:FAD/NAD(P)-binding protein n=1 Tax=Flavobacterium sp. HSC-32F16 TaxID=2910964 RepID=UPI0020A2AB52|nr:FAD/NAD(P)-binding protein [Flavobacterium sp. HSC-32F16]MCP2025173.1 putative NAD(P)/FAD-binding protein YdhS [Flavobacterium sp. HSC-32F16]
MDIKNTKKRIAILGGGPSGLFVYKRLVESGSDDFEITIFEKKKELGAGMPYSTEGANIEHITNVSDNEVPHIVSAMSEWIYTAPAELLQQYNIKPDQFNEYKVVPRLLFGSYLAAQFEMLRETAKKMGISTNVYFASTVTDIIYDSKNQTVRVETINGIDHEFDYAVICTGHNWPIRYEGKVPGYYDAPYPPVKLAKHFNHPIAVKGSSLTAIDAIRTLARNNGSFEKDADEVLCFKLNPESADFKIMMHSRSGMLPAVRFHLEDSHLSNDSLLTKEEIDLHRKSNDGFLSLDFIFEKDFKEIFREKDPEFYQRIKDFSIEDFVTDMMELRERLDPFQLLRAEYVQAEKSIKRQQSIYWKEMLAVLSFAMNHPAKYFSAEDMQRLQKVLMPLISIVIAFVPQKSCEELLALYMAGVLDLIPVGDDSSVEPQNGGGVLYNFTDSDNNKQSVFYKTFVDCVGQPHLSYSDFPFKSLLDQKAVSPARLKFKSKEAGHKAFINDSQGVQKDQYGDYFLNVSGIAINDNFQIMDQYGAYNKNLYIMAVPYIGGLNPDYSGLDFCEAASLRIVKDILRD